MKNRISFVLFLCLFAACQQTQQRVDVSVSQSFSDEWKFNPGIGDSSHFGWYRRTLVLSDSLQKAIQESGAAVVRLGKLAAADELYLNGKLVGKTGEFPDNYTGYHDEERNYLVSAGDFNLKGSNQMAILFFDGWSSGGFLEHGDLRISSALTRDRLRMSVTANDADYIFMPPNPIEIAVTIENENRWAVDGHLIVNLTTDDYQPVHSDSVPVTIPGKANYSNTFGLENPQPGFYRYTISFTENGELVWEKKFNVGYHPEKIVSPLDNKADFKSFWDHNLSELKKVAPQYRLTLVPEFSQSDYTMYLVEMKSFGDEWIRGYYGQPKREGKHPVIVEYMGYGSKPYPPHQTYDGFAYFVLSIRGQGLNEPANRFGTWITYGLDSQENYYYRGAFCDVVRAIDFVCSRPEIDAEKIAVRGGSQGGALSFVAAALDKRVKAAAPFIPFLSDYRDYFKIASWPRSDFENYVAQQKRYPEGEWNRIYDILSYFDIKNLAQWIECPLIMGIGVQDEVCPPHINFAAYNQVKSQKQWMAFPEHGHSVGNAFFENAMLLFKKELNITD